ncbi:MAG: glycosyltransferase family 4 protein [Calditrichia bacterium]
MNLLFLLPQIHSCFTGGNIYNREIIDTIKNRHQIHVTIWDSDPPAQTDWTCHAVLVDSLLLTDKKLAGVLAGLPDGAPRILLVHYLHLLDPAFSRSVKAAREKKALSLFNRLVCTSRFTCKGLQDAGISKEQLRVVKPGLSPLFFQAGNTFSESGPPQLLTVSSIFPGKGLIEFLDILENISDLPWRWKIVGETDLAPEYYQQFCRRVKASPMTGRIEITGKLPQEQLPAVYQESQVFVLPSQFETCSMVAMEAMLQGLPVLANAVGGLPELFADKTSDFLLPPGNAEKWEDRLRRLLSDRPLRRNLGQSALRLSSDFKSWDETAEDFERLVLKGT